MPSIVINGQERHLGLRPTPEITKRRFKKARDVIAVIPESQYQEIDSEQFIDHILNQSNQSACVAFSGVQSMMIARAREGLPYVELSAGSLYCQINGGRDDGASIGDALTALQQVGVCKASTIPQLGWKQAARDSSWHKEAADYKVIEALTCETVEEYLSGIVCGWTGNFGIGVGNKFDTDADGFLPRCDGSGINHSVCGCGLKKKGSEWFVIMANSWDVTWGKKGMCYVGLDWLRQPYQDLFLIRTTTMTQV
jgi:hypothetical protein